MCDTLTDADNARFLLSRRELGVATGAAGLVALLPSPADAVPVAGRDVTIRTPDGEAQAYYVAPSAGRHPGVLMWPDIMGLRPAFEQMARRLAESGYAVLVVNQFYRQTKTPFVGEGNRDAARKQAMEWRKALTAAVTDRDATAFLGLMMQQKGVDPKRLASTGYCMGGPMAFRTAALKPEVRAIASFHGAGLVSDQPDSPHLLIAKMRAAALVAIAQNDDARGPTDKDVLRKAFVAAKRPAEIEVYPAMHGWCPPDSQVYDKAQAEKAWARQLALFKTHL